MQVNRLGHRESARPGLLLLLGRAYPPAQPAREAGKLAELGRHNRQRRG
jgi:hypothetical protein